MKRATVQLLTLWLLAVVTGVALLLHWPDGDALRQYAGQSLVYAALTTFTLVFGVLLAEGELSPAHMVGMVASLSLPAAAQPVMAWAIFAGGVAAGLLLVRRPDRARFRRLLTIRSARSVVVMSARVTLTFVVGAQFYRIFGGALPLTPPLETQALALAVFSLLTVVVYLAVYLLEIYSDGHSVVSVVRGSLSELFAILVLPVPFAIISALLITLLPTSQVMFVGGTALVSLGLYGLSRAGQRLRDQVRELQSLAAVGGALQSNLDLPGLLDTIYRQVGGLLAVDSFRAVVLNAAGRWEQFVTAPTGGLVCRLDDAPAPDDDLLRHVLRTQAALLIADDVAGRARALGLNPPPEPPAAWLGVPLLAGGRLQGALVVASHDPKRRLTDDDQRLLALVAATAAVALDNARLYSRRLARAEQINLLNRVLSVLTGSLSPDEVLDAILSSASIIAEATAIAIYLFTDDQPPALMLTTSAGLGGVFSLEPPAPLLVSPHQPPVVVGDVRRDPRAAPYRTLLAREGKQAWVELPLAVGDTFLGVMTLYYDVPQEFSDSIIEILRTFAGQAAQAIKNARQYTTTDKALLHRIEQMSGLAALSRQLSATLDAHTICQLVLDRALQLSYAASGHVVLIQENTGQPVVMARAGYPARLAFDTAAVRQSVSGYVLQTGQAVRVQDVRAGTPAPPLLSSTRSVLSVPIERDAAILGAITLESQAPGAFGDEDWYFLSQLASQTIIAVDNTRLFARIAESRDRLEVILNAMTEGIVLFDRNGIIVLSNPRVELIGLNPAQLRGASVESLLFEAELRLSARMGFASDHELWSLVDAVRAPGEWVDQPPYAYTLEGDGGLVHIERQAIPISDAQGQRVGLLLVFYDQTEERALAQAREDLSRMIVHDLRSPLAAVSTGMKLLRDAVPQDVPYRALVQTTTETSERAIRKLLSRVDSLLDVSRLESGQLILDPEPAELATLVDGVCMELSPLAHELNVRLTSEVDDRTPLLNIDTDKIERVLQNLVDNALKFSPPNTTICLRAYPPGVGGAPPRFVRVDVTDQGPGVPDEYKTRLFERYAQMKGRRGTRRGVGLGLTFCKLVIEAQGGRIWIEDNPGGGSVFAFTLPVMTVERLDGPGEQPAAP